MILILTTEAGDYSHYTFIDWLTHLGADYFILSGEGIYNGRHSVSYNEGDLFVDGINFSKKVNVVLNRRFLTTSRMPELYARDSKLNQGLKRNVVNEIYEFHDFLPYINNAYWIPNRNATFVNKLNVIKKASKVGLKVPPFIVTNSKDDLLKFKEKHDKIITKAIGNFQPIWTKEKDYLIRSFLTKEVTNKLLRSLPERFCLSLFQQLILKKDEYRILYFEGNFFSAKLLSQENDSTKIDSRKQNNNEEEPLRIVKSDIPLKEKKQISDLMDSLNLNIGCIDLIRSTRNQWFFLEVNPVGQISGYSKRANLNFEKFVVEQMIKKDKRCS